MVSFLTEELVRRGHDVTLFATGDSKTSARLRDLRPNNLFDAIAEGEVWKSEYYQVGNIVEALRDAADFDVIHCHLGCFSIPFSALTRTPLVHSLPSPLDDDDLWVLARYPDAAVTARSRRQVAPVPPGRREKIQVIPNACDFDAYECSPQPGRYLAFLGRMAWQKSPCDAIAIARRAGLPLVLAGEPWYAEEHEYFEQQVRPLIDGTSVIHIGAVNDAQKAEFLKDASALLFPIQWEEPFGIVMIEAMACGVPVVACNRGAVSEVIDPGVTGFYADDVETLASLVPAALSLDRQAVRDHARQRFSIPRMVDQYLQLYESLLIPG
jgi:glycosyltransferase involved in cell wall biosynthesis